MKCAKTYLVPDCRSTSSKLLVGIVMASTETVNATREVYSEEILILKTGVGRWVRMGALDLL